MTNMSPLRGLLGSVIGIVVIGLVATAVFAVAIVVVSTGAGLAGYSNNGNGLRTDRTAIVRSGVY